LSSTFGIRPTLAGTFNTVAWAAVACVLSVGAGILVGVAPLIVLGIAGLAISTAAFYSIPMAVLLGIILARASLESAPFLPGSTVPETLVNAAVALGGGVTLLLTMRRLPTPWVTVPFAALLGLALVPMALGTPRVGLWTGLLALLVVFCLAEQVVRDQRALQRLVWALLASALVPLTMAAIQIAHGGAAQRLGGFSAVRGTFNFANGFAFYMMIALALGLVVLFETRSRWARALLVAGLVAGSLAFFITYTRSAWIAAVVVLVLLAVLQYRRMALWVAIAAAGAVVAFPSVMQTVNERFADLSSTSTTHSTSSWSWRVDNWTRMFPYALDKPTTGHGLGSYPALTVKEFGASASSFAHTAGGGPPQGIAAHNDYLALAVELGFLGPLLWIAVLVGLAVLMWRARSASRELRPYATVMFILMLVVTLLSGVDNLQSDGGVMYYLLIMAGAVTGVATAARSRNRASAASPPQ
jgi:O-antigen ligase